MEFTLPRVYVVPSTNTLPTTGTTAALTANQFGVFRQNYTPATAGNAAAADYLFLAQGRPNGDLNLGSNKGEWIYTNEIISKNLFTGTATSAVQISEISGFTASKGGQYSITIRAFSDLLDTASKRGFNRVYTVNGPCMECGDDPCAALDADQTEDMVDEFLAKMQADKFWPGFLTFSKSGTGLSTKIVVTGVAQTGFPQYCDIWANRYKLDAVTFDIFPEIDPPTTQDYSIPSPCNVFATVEVTQTPKFARGTYGEVREMEIEYYSYTVPKFKELYSDPSYNGLFHLNAEVGVVYDLFAIRARNSEKDNSFSNRTNMEFTNFIYSPQSKTAGIKAILEAKFGAFVDKTPA